MNRRQTSRAFQFIAAFCLVTLLGTSVPHVHEGAESRGGEPGRFDSSEFALLSDDAHEEHSSAREIAHMICALCRSEERCGDPQLLPVYPTCDQTMLNPAYADPTVWRTQRLLARLPLTRAPPTDPSV